MVRLFLEINLSAAALVPHQETVLWPLKVG
jgi:hypothetical protein